MACPGGGSLCIVDIDQNGIPETLLFADSLWTGVVITGKPAHVYGNGGCFDGVLDQNDIVSSVGGYYQVNFSKFGVDCHSELTLVSIVASDGNTPGSDTSLWLWWQDAALCAQGNTLCNLMQNGTPWEEWLVSVSWNPTTGLAPNGNGLTHN